MNCIAQMKVTPGRFQFSVQSKKYNQINKLSNGTSSRYSSNKSNCTSKQGVRHTLISQWNNV